VIDVFEKFSKGELTTISKAGPVTFPASPYYNKDSGTIAFVVQIANYKKALNAKRNPHVSVLYSHATGSKLGYSPVVLMKGLAKVHDEDLDHYWERYSLVHAQKSHQAYDEHVAVEQKDKRNTVPDYSMKRFVIEITPEEVVGWKEGDLDKEPEVRVSRSSS
jgi:hypothetical protein